MRPEEALAAMAAMIRNAQAVAAVLEQPEPDAERLQALTREREALFAAFQQAWDGEAPAGEEQGRAERGQRAASELAGTEERVAQRDDARQGDAPEMQTLRTLLAELRSLDDRCLELAQAHRERVLGEVRALRSGRRAVQAYGQGYGQGRTGPGRRGYFIDRKGL